MESHLPVFTWCRLLAVTMQSWVQTCLADLKRQRMLWRSGTAVAPHGVTRVRQHPEARHNTLTSSAKSSPTQMRFLSRTKHHGRPPPDQGYVWTQPPLSVHSLHPSCVGESKLEVWKDRKLRPPHPPLWRDPGLLATSKPCPRNCKAECLLILFL